MGNPTTTITHQNLYDREGGTKLAVLNRKNNTNDKPNPASRNSKGSEEGNNTRELLLGRSTFKLKAKYEHLVTEQKLTKIDRRMDKVQHSPA